jgi:hypothetical protein
MQKTRLASCIAHCALAHLRTRSPCCVLRAPDAPRAPVSGLCGFDLLTLAVLNPELAGLSIGHSDLGQPQTSADSTMGPVPPSHCLPHVSCVDRSVIGLTTCRRPHGASSVAFVIILESFPIISFYVRPPSSSSFSTPHHLPQQSCWNLRPTDPILHCSIYERQCCCYPPNSRYRTTAATTPLPHRVLPLPAASSLTMPMPPPRGEAPATFISTPGDTTLTALTCLSAATA